MQNRAKKIISNTLTVLLALITAWGIYLFSMAAYLGLVSAIFPNAFNRVNLVSEFLSKSILITISAIVVIPLVLIIVKSKNKRWETTRSISLLLWPYLVFSFITFYLSLFLVTQLNWFAVVGPNKEPHLFISGLFVLIVLASAYCWYVKKIKTLLLKK